MTEKESRTTLQLTADGELAVPLDAGDTARLRLRTIRRVCLTIFVIVFSIAIDIYLCKYVASYVVGALWTLGVIVLFYAASEISFIKAQFNRTTYPSMEVIQPVYDKNTTELKKPEITIRHDDFGSQVGQQISASQQNTFLLYSAHRDRVTDRAASILKYPYNGEQRFVYSLLVPIGGVAILFLTLGLWVFASAFIPYRIQLPIFSKVADGKIVSCEMNVQNAADIDVTYMPTESMSNTLTINLRLQDRTCSQVIIGSFQQFRYPTASPGWGYVDSPDLSPELPREDQLVILFTFLTWFGFLFLLIGVLKRVIISDLRFRYLRRKGEIRDGYILDHAWIAPKNIKNGPILALQFRFSTPDGRDFTTIQRIPEHVWNHRSIPPPGTPVAVLYADDANFKLL